MEGATIVLRNDLITQLSSRDNDAVTVSLNGYLIDVDAVTDARGGIVLMLDQQDLQDTLNEILRHTGKVP